MSTEENKAIVLQGFEALNKGSLDHADEGIAADFKSNFTEAPGREGYKQYFAGTLTALPDLHYSIDDVIAEGDKVAVRFTASGTQRGELAGVPPTGKHATWTGMVIFRVTEGIIVEAWAEFDALGLFQQLGVIPPLGGGEE